MLYKELRAARRKFIPILLVYVLTGVLVTTIFSFGESIFQSWILWTLLVTIGAAILGGADTISEENGKNTLSFLLTRPVNRTTIYTVKFLVSAGFLTVIYLATSLIMFLVDLQPQYYINRFIIMENGENKWVETSIPLDKISFPDVIFLVTMILAIGLAVLALTTLVSIFSSSAINTIVFTILLGVGLVVVYGLCDFFFGIHYSVNQAFDLKNGLGLGDFFLLLAIAVGIYFAGLKIFKAKEF